MTQLIRKPDNEKMEDMEMHFYNIVGSSLLNVHVYIHIYASCMCTFPPGFLIIYLPDFSSFQPFISHNNFLPFSPKKAAHLLVCDYYIISSLLSCLRWCSFSSMCILYICKNMNIIFTSFLIFSFKLQPAFRLHYDFVFLLTI